LSVKERSTRRELAAVTVRSDGAFGAVKAVRIASKANRKTTDFIEIVPLIKIEMVDESALITLM